MFQAGNIPGLDIVIKPVQHYDYWHKLNIQTRGGGSGEDIRTHYFHDPYPCQRRY